MEHPSVWSIATAKARLSEIIERARSEPQVITRNGKPTAVVITTEEWERRTRRRETLADFLLQSPLRGVDLDLDRVKDELQDLEI